MEKLNSDFEKLSNQLKESYYETMVQDLKTSNPSQWYSKVKRMSTINQTKDEEIIVEQIKNETSQKQAEIIADQFASISNLYQPLKTEDIDIPSDVNSEPVPLFEPMQIYEKIKSMKKKASTVPGDIPWRIISEFSVELAFPLSNIYNSASLAGVWPRIWKFEYITPVPKVFPPETTDELKKISGTKNFSKVFEALVADPILEDMEPKMDQSQFGNTKGLSIQHYLVKFVNNSDNSGYQ